MGKKKSETKTETPETGTATAVVEEPTVTETPIPEGLANEYDEILNRPPAGEGEPKKAEPEPKEEPKKETEPEPKPEPEPPPEPEQEEEDIPQHLVDAGRAHGYTDAKIIKLAEDHPDVLEDLARDYERIQSAAAAKEAPKGEIKQPEESGKLKPVHVDTSRFDDETSQVVKTLVDEVNKDRELINKLSESVSGVGQKLSAEETKRQIDFDLRIDNIFDSVADVPQFGKKESLTTSQQKARDECYGIARSLSQNSGGSIEQNLSKAVKAYKGMYGVGDSSATTLRAKLNKQKTKFTARPGGQKTQPTYKTEEEKGYATMDAKGRELGIW